MFTNKRGLLFFTQFILRGIPFEFFTSKQFLSGFVYNVKVLMSPYSYCFDILLACNMSSISFYTSLLEHCQCFPREDVFLILALGKIRGNTVSMDHIL